MTGYSPPESAGAVLPELSDKFRIDVLKNGAIAQEIDLVDVLRRKAGVYHVVLGRATDQVDVPALHGSISRQHCVLQFTKSQKVLLYDLGAAHGTFLNGKRVKPKQYYELADGSVLRLGASTRDYIFSLPHKDMVVQARQQRQNESQQQMLSLTDDGKRARALRKMAELTGRSIEELREIAASVDKEKQEEEPQKLSMVDAENALRQRDAAIKDPAKIVRTLRLRWRADLTDPTHPYSYEDDLLFLLAEETAQFSKIRDQFPF
ncbi:MAG: hypothetical protein MHM6MM_008942, partial [Cercozoa sp. M6MM]